MQTKFNIGDCVWVTFEVSDIHIMNSENIYYNLKEVSEYRKGIKLMDKREDELIEANFKKEYDVEPEEKRGKWINSERCDGVEIIKCSNCKTSIAKHVEDSTGWFMVVNVNPKYCPWCGAKMKEESEVEE